MITLKMKTFNKFFEGVSEIDVKYLRFDKEYITKLKSSDCYLANTPKDDDKEYECDNISVYWGLIFNDSNIGLSRIEVYVKQITCEVTMTMIDELGDIVGNPVEEELVFNYDKIDCTVEMDSDKEISYSPKDLTIYYDKKECAIEIGN
jgi:hypothetical protein